jgi:hypothetical protein
MTKRQTTHYIKEILAVKDDEGNNLFDTVSLVRKPQGRRGQRYAISVRDVKSGQTVRISTKREIALFLKKCKRGRRTALAGSRK